MAQVAAGRARRPTPASTQSTAWQYLPIAFAFLGLALSLVVLFWAAANTDLVHAWTNSDALYPVNLTTDIVGDGYSLSGWRFSIAPCWFPDLFAAGFFWIITHNVIIATLLAGFIQFPLIIVAFEVVRRAVGARTGVIQAVVLCAVAIATALLVAAHGNIAYPDLHRFFIPQSHVGSLMMSIYAMALAMFWIRRTHDGTKVSATMTAAYAGVCLLAGMSNLMFFPQMLMPLTAAAGFAVFFGVLTIRDCWRPLAFGWPTAILGAILNRVLFHTTSVHAQSEISRSAALTALDVFMRGAVQQLFVGETLHVLAAAWVVTCVLVMAFTLRKLTRTESLVLTVREKLLFFFCCCWLFSDILSCAAIIGGGSNGLTVLKDYIWTTHYLQSVFFIPLFGIPVVLCWSGWKLSDTRYARYATALLSIVLFAGSAVALARAKAPDTPLASYRPPLVRFLDGIAPQYHLKYGLAGYWQSRPLTLLSKRGLRVYAINRDVTPFLWANNSEWYTESVEDRSKRPPVDFVVLDDPAFKIPRAPVVAAFGEPLREVRFENTRVLIYAGAHPDLSAWPPAPQPHIDTPLREFSDRISSPTQMLCASPGQTLTVPLVLANTSHERWASAGTYPVTLSYKWLDSGRMLDLEGERTYLRRAVNPGEQVRVAAVVTAPAAGQHLTLRFSLVQEGVAWFMNKGAPVLDVPVDFEGCRTPSK